MADSVLDPALRAVLGAGGLLAWALVIYHLAGLDRTVRDLRKRLG